MSGSRCPWCLRVVRLTMDDFKIMICTDCDLKWDGEGKVGYWNSGINSFWGSSRDVVGGTVRMFSSKGIEKMTDEIIRFMNATEHFCGNDKELVLLPIRGMIVIKCGCGKEWGWRVIDIKKRLLGRYGDMFLNGVVRKELLAWMNGVLVVKSLEVPKGYLLIK